MYVPCSWRKQVQQASRSKTEASSQEALFRVVGEGEEDVGPSARIVRTRVRRERRKMRRMFILA